MTTKIRRRAAKRADTADGPMDRELTEGMVVTTADIASMQAAQRERETARAYSDSIVDTLRQPVVVVGFTVGGWVTGGTVAQMSRVPASGAQAELAATICVAKFIGGPDAQVQLATLKESNSWGRDTLIEKGGWVALPGMKSPVSGAADRCAQRLMETDVSTTAAGTHKKG